MTVAAGTAEARPQEQQAGYETEDSDAEHRDADRGSATTVLAAFTQVRALMWREEWLKRQIELLSCQRDETLEGLNKVRSSKKALAPPYQEEAQRHGWYAQGSTEEKAITAAAAAAAAATSAAAEGGAAAKLAPQGLEEGGEEEREGRCARMEAWGAALVGRRRLLVQSHVPLANMARALAPLSLYHLNPKKSHHKSQHHHHHRHGVNHHKKRERDTDWDMANDNVRDDGRVEAGGRKLVTATGQKLIIKFSGKVESPRSGPMSPALGSRNARSGLRPSVFVDKRPHKALALSNSRGNSPRLGPSSNPSTPRSADWGIDDYVYGGPRTHTKIETVQAKEIYTPKWVVLDSNEGVPRKMHRGGHGSSSSSRLQASKKSSPHSSFSSAKDVEGAAGGAGGSSSEDTDDETYLARHRPYEEQEIRFRYPKLVERERKYKEALKREGLEVEPNEPEDKYKSLWYSGRSASDKDLSAALKKSEQSSGDERSPRPTDKLLKESPGRVDTVSTPEGMSKVRSPGGDTSEAGTPATDPMAVDD